MKNALSLVLGFATVLPATSAFAQRTITCVTAPNEMRSSNSVTIVEKNDGTATIQLSAQGGIAQFVTGVGPLSATVQHEPDGTFYQATDSFGQQLEVAVITSALDGKLQTTASTNYGLWQDAVMICK